MLSQQLRALMKARGYSIRRLASESGLGVGTISSLLRGGTEPTLGTMLALVDCLQLASLEELLAPLGTSLALERG